MVGQPVGVWAQLHRLLMREVHLLQDASLCSHVWFV
jgi:hypothetical protein